MSKEYENKTKMVQEQNKFKNKEGFVTFFSLSRFKAVKSARI